MPFKSEKQRKWMWANDPDMAQRWEDEEKKGKKKKRKKRKSPKMKKGDLVEYIKNSYIIEANGTRRGGQYNFPSMREIENQERRDIMKYFESIRQSGIINMYGAAPILNWTKDDLHRFLYGERNDPESIEREIEEEERENEDGENDNTISILEDKLEKINYLLDNKQKIRDVLIRAALNRIDNTDGNHEMRNVQRIFEKMAKEAWHFWVGIQQI